MDMFAFSAELEKAIEDSPVYLRFDPEIGDFTKPTKSSLTVCGKKYTATTTLDNTEEGFQLNSIVAVLAKRVFNKGSTVLTWDIKRFLSYLAFHLKNYHPVIEANLIDLRYSEAYCGIEKPKPKDFREAMIRTKSFVQNKDWLNIYKKIHLPLALTVLPQLESRGLLDLGNKQVRYINYEIEGQTNGRMSCSRLGPDFLNVHGLTPELREQLATRRELNRLFVELDFHHMEVNVLQWLSGDQQLRDIIESGADVYASIYELLRGQSCVTAEQRSFAKQVFLPVMFGMQANSLAAKVGMTLEQSQQLIAKLAESFPTSFKWMLDKELEIQDCPQVTDYFGRIRDFSNVPPYKRRNFEIQSPASAICLERLIKLYEELGDHLLFHVHDAYVLCCEASELKQITKQARSVLESPSDLCPGLKLTVDCHVGYNLSVTKLYPK